MALQLRAVATTIPAPLSIAPSQAWQGNDGPWSTFPIRVGTPEQVFQVMISTAGQETWLPVPEGCIVGDPSDCGAQRGALPFNGIASNGFQINSSSTWQAISLYELGLDKNLNYTGNGTYGFDTVGLALPQSGGPTLQHQIVAGYADKSFYMGVLGLGPKPTNFTDFNSPSPSFFWSLRNKTMIPSLTWAYTAGAPYQLKKVPGSLTFGGYDSSRFVANDMTFSFAADDSKPLTVGLQTILATNTLQGLMSLLPTSGILAFIDSTVPEMWLPVAACTVFETAFGLTYDPHTDRYLVDDVVHAKLISLNPVVTFKLGNTRTGGNTTSIALPYAAFDLQASYPIYNNKTNYFPLRKATVESQYTLGRVFLQEAYVIADFDRGNFSVSQCLFKENSPSVIVAIHPPETPGSKSEGLAKGTLIGIIVAAVVGLLIACSGIYVYLKWKKRKAAGAEEDIRANATAAEGLGILGAEGEDEEGRIHRYSELMGNKPSDMPSEMGMGEVVKVEMDGEGRRSELPSPNFSSPVSPMPAELSAEPRSERPRRKPVG